MRDPERWDIYVPRVNDFLRRVEMKGWAATESWIIQKLNDFGLMTDLLPEGRVAMGDIGQFEGKYLIPIGATDEEWTVDPKPEGVAW